MPPNHLQNTIYSNNSFQPGTSGMLGFLQYSNTRKSKYFQSKEYLELIKKVYGELKKIEILVAKIDKADCKSNIFECKNDFSVLSESHKAAQYHITKILQRNTAHDFVNPTVIGGYKITYAIGSTFFMGSQYSTWPVALTKGKCVQACQLLNKALFICPKSDVFEITRTATLLEKCNLILPAIN
ncbi:hypothetical protein N9W79_01310 [bacterium]|nr:hypothetical protein [bacterium]